jgi:hypothetical protein
VTRHVPGAFAVRVELESEHVEVPAEYAKDSAPVPEPPEVVSVRGVP